MTLTVEWPAGVPFRPLRQPLELAPMPQFQAMEMDGGWTDRENLFTVVPAFYQVDLELTLAQFEILKGWWRHTLHRGARVFQMPVWRGWEYTDTQARMGVEPWRARQPDGDTWTPSIRIEILDLPTLTAQETAALQLVELYTQAGAVAMLGDLNDLVHVSWPAAMTP